MTENNGNSEDPLGEDAPSKTRRKKDMIALQDLGEHLTRLPPTQLEKLDLPADLQLAIAEFKRIPNRRGAKKRQLQFIGRLMRDVDPEPIRKVLDEEGQQVELQKRHFHHLEQLREQLLVEDQATLDVLIRDYPDLDIQYIRQLVRQAKKEAGANKPPAASRKLFAYLRQLT